MNGATTRRQLVARTIGLGSADAPLLTGLARAELLVIAVYERVIATGLLSERVEAVARRALSQEHEHVTTIGRELDSRGLSLPAGPKTADAVNTQLSRAQAVGSVDELHNEHDCVHLLLEAEAVVEGAYFKAIPKLQDLALARLAAQILANEAQHASVLSEARRPGNIFQAVSDAFVEGKH